VTRTTYAGALIVLLLALIAGPPAFAARGATPSPVTIGVVAGYDQRYVTTKGVPVSIVLESTRAVAGDLEVSSVAQDGSTLVRAMPVEVPAGGKKQFDLVIPGPAVTSPRLQIAVKDSGGTLASTNIELIGAGKQLLIGSLEQQPASGLGGVRIEPTGHELRPVLVPDAWLELGPAALQPLSYLILDSDRARRTPEDRLQAIFDWVVSGGRLLVTTRDPSSLDWLPQAWRSDWTAAGAEWTPAPGGAGRVVAGGAVASVAGLGRVVVAPNRSPADLAAVVAGMTPATATAGSRNDVFLGPAVDFELLGVLSGNAGGAVRLGWLVGFLLIYVLVAGPLNYVILRKRGRKELAWVTIPVLAFVFSGVAYGLAQGTRGGLSVEQASVVFATAEGHTSHRLVTVSSGAGGRHTVEFGSKDALQPWGIGGFEPFGNVGPGRSRQVVRLTGAGSEAILETSPFSAGIAQGSLDSSPGYLEGNLSWDGSAFAGEVVNRTNMALDVAVVPAGRREVEVGELAPGESKEVRFESAQLAGPPSFRDPFFGRSGLPSSESIRRTLLGTTYSMLGAEQGFGTPLLVGFTEDFAPELTVDGSRREPSGPAMIASPLEISVNGGAQGTLPAMTGEVDLLFVDGSVSFVNNSLQLADYREAVFAYSLPRGLEAARVKDATLTTGFDGVGFKIEAFDRGAGRWVEAPKTNSGKEMVPATAFSEAGQVYLRLSPLNEPYIGLWAMDLEVNLL
jgi:hypothetical protein